MSSFASKNDLSKKKISFTEIGVGCYAYTTEGDPNSGVIIGEKAVMVIEAQATPIMARDVIAKVRSITDKPIKYLVLSHYHAVRVLGASEFKNAEIIMSSKSLEMIKERGQQDWLSEFERFPRLFEGHESIPGLTWPTKIFDKKLSINLGNKQVQLLHLGEGHTRGDIVAWVPEEKVLFAGDLVESGATPYCGDAQLENWPTTLDAISNLAPVAMVPGRGNALTSFDECKSAIQGTKDYVSTLLSIAKNSIHNKEGLKQCHDQMIAQMKPKFGHWVIFDHCMCFNASRAYDEASGIAHPRVWTADRDLEMWGMLNAKE